jgi:hypothetical protein
VVDIVSLGILLLRTRVPLVRALSNVHSPAVAALLTFLIVAVIVAAAAIVAGVLLRVLNAVAKRTLPSSLRPWAVASILVGLTWIVPKSSLFVWLGLSVPLVVAAALTLTLREQEA